MIIVIVSNLLGSKLQITRTFLENILDITSSLTLSLRCLYVQLLFTSTPCFEGVIFISETFSVNSTFYTVKEEINIVVFC